MTFPARDGVRLAGWYVRGRGGAGLTEPVFVASTWLGMRATELLSGDDEPAPLAAIVRRIRVPVLLIASSSAGERTLAEAFRRRIGPRATVWYVPDASHTGALERHPGRYRARTLAFLAGMGPH